MTGCQIPCTLVFDDDKEGGEMNEYRLCLLPTA